MTRNWKPAAALFAALALASCSGTGTPGQFGAEDEFGAAPAQFDSNTVGAAILLALLVVVSVSN
jgi:hypothetical protein